LYEKELLWVYHIEMRDHLGESFSGHIIEMKYISVKELLWEYHIPMKDLLCERAPLGISYTDERSSL
jgi:hypothetical protein